MISLLKGYFSYLIIFPCLNRRRLEKCYVGIPRITLVFLLIRSPKLTLIEVRWMYLQRKAINNITFESEKHIGKKQ